MDIGMLWYVRKDYPERSLAGKIARAALYYEEKHKARPNACAVCPADMAEGMPAEFNLDGIQVFPDAILRPGYLWIGVKSDKPRGPGVVALADIARS